MQTVDFHVHLLNPNVKFDKVFEKIALKIFGKQFGFDLNMVKKNPYLSYTDALTNSIKESSYIKKAVLLPVDSIFSIDGIEISRDKTVCSHNKDVLKIYKKYPDIILPFMSINPYRKNALNLIEKYAKKGFLGAKFLQNYWGIDINNEKLIPYYEKLIEFDLPLIIHIGSEYSIKSIKRYESIDMINLPLKRGVKVVVAHMGVGDIKNRFIIWRNFSNNPKYFNHDYFKILDLMEKYDNLYADISALLTPLKSKVLKDLSTRGIEDKLLFATDYPVVFSTILCSCNLNFKKRLELNRIKNPFDRYIETILEYFPKDSPIYSNYKKIIKNIN